MTALEKALVAPRNLSVEELVALLESADEGLWREADAANGRTSVSFEIVNPELFAFPR